MNWEASGEAESSTNKDTWSTDSALYLLTLPMAQAIFHMTFPREVLRCPGRWPSQLIIGFQSSQVLSLVTHIYKPSPWEVEVRGA